MYTKCCTKIHITHAKNWSALFDGWMIEKKNVDFFKERATVEDSTDRTPVKPLQYFLRKNKLYYYWSRIWEYNRVFIEVHSLTFTVKLTEVISPKINYFPTTFFQKIKVHFPFSVSRSPAISTMATAYRPVTRSSNTVTSQTTGVKNKQAPLM